MVQGARLKSEDMRDREKRGQLPRKGVQSYLQTKSPGQPLEQGSIRAFNAFRGRWEFLHESVQHSIHDRAWVSQVQVRTIDYRLRTTPWDSFCALSQGVLQVEAWPDLFRGSDLLQE